VVKDSNRKYGAPAYLKKDEKHADTGLDLGAVIRKSRMSNLFLLI
jgi:hypothetical protein